MSRPSSDAEPDIYVGLLWVSVAALMVGCIFLIAELQRYQWQL